MTEVRFLKALAGFYGYPIIMIVCFVLLIFWLCRIFNNNALVDLPENNPRPRDARPAVPPRQIPLRNLATIALLFIVCHIAGTRGVSAENSTEKSCLVDVRTRIKQLGFTLKRCTKETVTLESITMAVCEAETIIKEKDCYKMADLAPIFTTMGALVAVMVIALILQHRGCAQSDYHRRRPTGFHIIQRRHATSTTTRH